MTSSSPIHCEIDLHADGKHAGYLRLPHSAHRSAYGWLPIPIVSIRRGDRPRVLLMAGNHGDEYEGQVALSEIARWSVSAYPRAVDAAMHCSTSRRP
jgi:predicted deacylase